MGTKLISLLKTEALLGVMLQPGSILIRNLKSYEWSNRFRLGIGDALPAKGVTLFSDIPA